MRPAWSCATPEAALGLGFSGVCLSGPGHGLGQGWGTIRCLGEERGCFKGPSASYLLPAPPGLVIGTFLKVDKSVDVNINRMRFISAKPFLH